MIGCGIGLLPVGACARCGLRGVPLALSSCPRCGAWDGWLQVDRAACAVFLVALYVEQRESVRRLVERSHEQILATLQGDDELRDHALQGLRPGAVFDVHAEPDLGTRAQQLAEARLYGVLDMPGVIARVSRCT